jgi:hypothetical protein
VKNNSVIHENKWEGERRQILLLFLSRLCLVESTFSEPWQGRNSLAVRKLRKEEEGSGKDGIGWLQFGLRMRLPGYGG